MKKKDSVLVTGGAGFIGSHMVDLLIKKNFKVRVLDNFTGGHEDNLKHLKNNSDLIIEKIDIKSLGDTSIFKNIKYVFHFAGIGDIVPSIEKPVDYLSTNVQGTVNVLEYSRENNVKKFVYAASSSCYGIAKTPTNENHLIKPEYPYALSKYLGEKICFHWNKIYKMPINSIRIFNAYGTRSRTTGAYGAVFGVFLKQKIDGKPFTIVGTGNQKRDFIYVTDVAEAFYLAATTKLSGKIWNIGNNNPISINQLTKLLGENKKVYLPRRPKEPFVTWADNRRIKKDLKWRPKINFSDGVKLVLKELDHWKDAPLWTEKKILDATKAWFKVLDNKN